MSESGAEPGPRCFAVVTGGGTAGHVLPAIAVAEALVAAGHDASSIRYVGAQRGIETRLMVDTPFPTTLLDVVGFQRRLDLRNVVFAPKMITATRTMIRSVREVQPAVVVSVGGYASMPSVFAAQRLGIPVVVVSYDRTPGRASRMAARRAAACAVAFPGSTLPRAVVTGAPLRQEILAVDRTRDRAAARTSLSIPDDRFLIVVMGGSQGSGLLNDAVARYVDSHRADEGLALIQLAGDRFVDGVTSVGDGSTGVLHRVVGYEPNMSALYAASDLLIGRGGASTVHEVAATGTPAILSPWSGATDDHQADNVRWLTDAGAAVLLPESRIAELGSEIDRLRRDDAIRLDLGNIARVVGEVHHRGALAGLIERVAVTSRPS